jgi:hypothetical protein
MGEYLSRMGDFDAQRFSQQCQGRSEVVSALYIEFYTPLHDGDPDNPKSRESSI